MARSLIAAPSRPARPRRPRPPVSLDSDLARLNGRLLGGQEGEPAAPRLALDPPAGAKPRRDPAVWSDFFGLWV